MGTIGTRASQVTPGTAGLVLAIVSAASFGTSGTFAAALIGSGWSPGAAVLARVAVAALILTGPALVRLRGQWAMLRRGAGRVIAYGLLAVAAPQLCYFEAVARIPVGVAVLLEYLGVVLVVGWLWLRHGQRPRRLTITGAAVAIGGLAMMLNLASSAGISPAGMVWALLGAVGLATFFLLSAGGAEEPLPPLVMTWAGMCVGTAALGTAIVAGALPVNAGTGAVLVFGHQVSWIVPVLGLSLVAAVISYVTGIAGARRLGAKLASFVSMAEVLFATAFAWLLLGQLPTPAQFAGGALILAGVTMVRLDELRPASGHPVRAPAQRPGLAGSRASDAA